MLDTLLLAQDTVTAELNLTLPGILALVAGILILVFPRLLNYIVAIYLILAGLVMIFDLKL